MTKLRYGIEHVNTKMHNNMLEPDCKLWHLDHLYLHCYQFDCVVDLYAVCNSVRGYGQFSRVMLMFSFS
jgi:hypothetical protein